MTGPTGVGKSSLALALAERLDGEILGADAFQIYAGLPVLTAQPTPEQLAVFGTPDYVIYNAGVFPCNRLSKVLM